MKNLVDKLNSIEKLCRISDYLKNIKNETEKYIKIIDS